MLSIGISIRKLNQYYEAYYSVHIIRPRWKTNEHKDAAFAQATKLVGLNYNFFGTIGFNYPNKYYFSELAVNIYKQWYRPVEKLRQISKPGDLYLYGNILYDSLPREEIE